MAKVTGNFDSTFWNMQRQAPARIINTSAGQVIGLTRRKVSRKVKNRLREQSPLRLASVAWRELEQSQRDDWSAVASSYGLNGWQLFLQRSADEQKNGPVELGGYSYAYAYYGWGSAEENNTPNHIAMHTVGKLKVIAPGTGATITQNHPDIYNLRRVIPQSKKVFETVEIQENLTLPLEIGTSWKTELVAAGSLPSVEFYATIEYENEGIISYHKEGFHLGLQDDWRRDTIEITAPSGTIHGYSISFSVIDCVGSLFFDNILTKHTGTNFAIDPFCYDVNQKIVQQWGDINRPWNFEDGATNSTLTTVKLSDLSIA